MNGAQADVRRTRRIDSGFSHWEKNPKMKVRTALLVAAAALVLLPRNSVAEFLQQPASPTLDPAQNSAPPSGTQTTNLPPQSDQAPASAPLRVMVGKSLLINTTERLTRVSVTDSAIAEIVIVSTTQILVHGRTPGEVSLLIWDELQRSRSFESEYGADSGGLPGPRSARPSKSARPRATRTTRRPRSPRPHDAPWNRCPSRTAPSPPQPASFGPSYASCVVSARRLRSCMGKVSSIAT